MKTQFNKSKFNVNSKDDLSKFKEFLETMSWNGPCPFELEFPYLTIPDMIKDKISHHFLKAKRHA